jgi:hypothetical protein
MTGNTGNGLVRITRVCVTICIESVTPSKGSISGNTTITITGRGFAANAVVTLDYNGTPAACLSVVVAADGKSLTCVTSAHASGYVSVKVENPAAPGTPTNFTYTGAVQPYTASITGQYILETWGAEGGEMVYSKGGKGGYATGKINLTAGTTLYIYVGSKGGNQSTPGWNGGGASSITQNAHMASGGGGATDIRTVGGNWNDSSGLASRIIVAGGGGGAAYYNIGGAGGGSVGQTGIYSSTSSTYCNAAAQGSGGTQSAGGAGGIHLSSNSNTNGAAGIFGIGGAGGDNGSNYAGASGGGGYWGGGGGAGFWCAGGGGSGYVGSLSSSSLIGGDVTNAMPNPSGGTMTGNTGNGYARITAPAQAADFATCDSCFLYVETFIELTVPTVNVTLSMSNSTPYNYASSDIRVTTNNPTGYKLYLAATGALDASHPEDAVCLDDTLYRFTPTNSGTLPAKTWGLQIGNAVSNSNWLTPTVANMEFAGSSTASGPASNGATYNTHKLWIGAKTDGSLPACVYETSLLVTAVGTNP